MIKTEIYHGVTIRVLNWANASFYGYYGIEMITGLNQSVKVLRSPQIYTNYMLRPRIVKHYAQGPL